jgi:carbon-monoxide dehydrogenase small subunit
MLFSAQDLLSHTPAPTDEEIRLALSGNLCRCTGYDTIVSAVRRAADGTQDGPGDTARPAAAD